MRLIPLTAVASQSFTIVLDGNVWEVTVNQSMIGPVVDVIVNGTTIASGLRAIAYVPVLFSSHLGRFGNLVFACPSEDIPDYTKFGGDHELYYLSKDEVAEWREQVLQA